MQGLVGRNYRGSGRSAAQRLLTGKELGALEVLVWMDVAWAESEVDAHQQEQEIRPPPHGECLES